jgi:hypothetical protein
MAHACLRPEMHYRLEALAGKQRSHASLVRQIEPYEAKTRLSLQLLEPRHLQRYVVVVVEIVEPDDLIAARQ